MCYKKKRFFIFLCIYFLSFSILSSCGGADSASEIGSEYPSWTFTKQLGLAESYTNGNSVATDINGNVYVAGWIDGDKLDGNTLNGTTDLFLTKYNTSGVKQYTILNGSMGADTYGDAVATDVNGNVYLRAILGWSGW